MKKPKYVEIKLKLKIRYTEELDKEELKEELKKADMDYYFMSKIEHCFKENYYYTLEFDLLKPTISLK